MKYKVLKEKIHSLSFHVWREDLGSPVVECVGFVNHYPTPIYLGHQAFCLQDIPDVVEEVSPAGSIDFDDWDDVVEPIPEDDFYFSIPQRTRFDGVMMKGDYLICICRGWVEPVE